MSDKFTEENITNSLALSVNLETGKCKSTKIDTDIEKSALLLAAKLFESYPDSVIICPQRSSDGLQDINGVIAFKSPQTGGLYFNFCSPAFSSFISSKNYVALIVSGSLQNLGTVKLTDKKAEITVSEELNNLSVSETIKKIGTNAALIIGPAGENEINFANVFCFDSSCGRGGLGEVLGSKKLKALYFKPDKTDKAVEDDKEKTEISLNKNDFELLKLGIKHHWIPLDNFRHYSDPRLVYLLEPEFNKRIKSLKSPYFDKLLLPSYEELVMLGPNVECFSPETITLRYNFALDMGLDPVSLGNVLGWMKESGEYDLDYTDNKKVFSLTEQLACGDSRLRKSLLFYYESPLAYRINGLECGSYDFRGNFAQALNCALGNWFSVLFSYCPELLKNNPAFWVYKNEEIMMGLQALGVDTALFTDLIKDLDKFKIFCLKLFKNEKTLSFIFDFLFRKKVRNQLGYTLKEITDLGKKCRKLVRKINSKYITKAPGIPEFFCINPQSSKSYAVIVPFVKLLSSYKRLSEMDF